uniref:DH domain-containing protein n=1 Tax=Mesocestoides corti TaxID=53468 RepID=A0A5K3FM54_MESCO
MARQSASPSHSSFSLIASRWHARRNETQATSMPYRRHWLLSKVSSNTTPSNIRPLRPRLGTSRFLLGGSHCSSTGVCDEVGGADTTSLNNSSLTSDRRSGNVSRAGSGASGISKFGRGLDAKKRHHFTHLFLLQLQDVKRVLDLNTMSPERAAFSLIVRGASEEFDHVYTFCLAASFAATAALASGKCPEAVQSAVAAATAGGSCRQASFKDLSDSTTSTVEDEEGVDSALTKLQHCVHMAKTTFLRRLCHSILQVSFVASSPEDLLVEMQPDVVLDFDLDNVFSSMGNSSFKSKKFPRHLGRAISMKTPRRLPNARTNVTASAMPSTTSTAPHHTSGKHVEKRVLAPIPLDLASGSALSSAVSLKPTVEDEEHLPQEFTTPSRPSVLGSLFGGLRSHAVKAATCTPIHSMTKCTNHVDTKAEADDGEDSFNTSFASHATTTTPPLTPTVVVRGTPSQKDLWLDVVTEFASDDETSEGVDLEEDDMFSLDSCCSHSGPWPASLPHPPPTSRGGAGSKGETATASTSSLSSAYSQADHAGGGQSRQSFSGLVNATRKSICRSFLVGMRRPKEPGQHRNSAASSSMSRVAPLARVDDDEAGGSSQDCLSRRHLPRLHSADSKTPSNACGLSTPGLDKSASECNLSHRKNHPGSRVATSSTASIKNLFASPFRVPTAPAVRNSVAATLTGKSQRSVSKTAQLSQSPTSGSITSWCSLMGLDERRHGDADEDEEVAIRYRCKASTGAAMDTCSMIVHPSPSSIFGSKKLKLGKKGKASRRLYGSAIFFQRPKKEEKPKADDSNSVAASAGRRESIFRRNFLFK